MQHFHSFLAREQRLLGFAMGRTPFENFGQSPEQQKNQQRNPEMQQRYQINHPHQAPMMAQNCQNDAAKELRMQRNDMIVVLHKEMRGLEAQAGRIRNMLHQADIDHRNSLIRMQGVRPGFNVKNAGVAGINEERVNRLLAELKPIEARITEIKLEIERLDKTPVPGEATAFANAGGEGQPDFAYGPGGMPGMGPEFMPGRPPYDIEAAFASLPPDIAKMVRELPPIFHEPVLRTLSGLSDVELLQAKSLLQKIHALPPFAAQFLMLHPLGEPLPTKEAILKTLDDPSFEKTVPGAVEGAKAYAEFIGSLQPQERELLQRTLSLTRYINTSPDLKRGARPLEMENPDMQQKVRGLAERYNSATTEKQQMMAEGLLRISGVDVERSNFKTGQIFMLPEQGPEKFLGLITGLLQIVTAMHDKENKPLKKEAEHVPAPEPNDMKKEEREQAIRVNKKEIAELNKEKSDLEANIKKLEDTSPSDAESAQERDARVKKIEKSKNRIKEIEKKIKELEEQNKKFQTANDAAEKKGEKLLSPEEIKEGLRVLIRKKLVEGTKSNPLPLVLSREGRESYLDRVAKNTANAIEVRRMANGDVKLSVNLNGIGSSENRQESNLMWQALETVMTNYRPRESFYGTIREKEMSEADLRTLLELGSNELPVPNEMPLPPGEPKAPKTETSPNYPAPKPPEEGKPEEVPPPNKKTLDTMNGVLKNLFEKMFPVKEKSLVRNAVSVRSEGNKVVVVVDRGLLRSATNNPKLDLPKEFFPNENRVSGRLSSDPIAQTDFQQTNIALSRWASENPDKLA